MSPSLYGLYTDQLEAHLQHHAQDAPELQGQKVSTLLYADDIVLMSRSSAGLQHLLHVLQLFCGDKLLLVIMSKTQVVICNEFWHSHSDVFCVVVKLCALSVTLHIWELVCTNQVVSKQQLISLQLQASLSPLFLSAMRSGWRYFM